MKFSTLEAFSMHLKEINGNFPPFYLIVGKDPFERRKALEELKKAPFEWGKSFHEESPIDQFMAEFETQSLFSQRQAIFLFNIDRYSKKQLEIVEKAIQNPHPCNLLVLTAESLPKGKKNWEKGVVIEFPDLKPKEKEKKIGEWLKRMANLEGKKMPPAVCQFMIQHCGTDFSSLENELEKLFCYSAHKQEISIQDVQEICIKTDQRTIWQLGEAIFLQKGAEALQIAKTLLEEGSPFLVLLKQIRSQFQIEFQVCSLNNPDAIAKEFPYMKGFILERHLKLAQNYGAERFKKGLLLIDKIEGMAKSSLQDEHFLTELLITQLTL